MDTNINKGMMKLLYNT